MVKPAYIAVDGLDGCGKSTLLKKLADYLDKRGIKNKRMSMLGSGLIRDAVLSEKRHPDVELLLFVAASIETSNQVQQHLNLGYTVLMDRSPLTLHAYQGAGRNRLSRVSQLYEYFPIVEPDVMFYLSSPIEVLEERLLLRGKLNHLDDESFQFKHAVKNFFDTAAEGGFERFKTVDATLNQEEVLQQVLNHLQETKMLSL